MFFAALGVSYVIASLIIGMFLTFVTWDKGNTFGFITFMLCSMVFAVIWPLIALVTFTDGK